MSANRILIVEDEAKLRNHLVLRMTDEGFSTSISTTYSELESQIADPVQNFEVVVLDRLLHGRDSASLITQMKNRAPELKILIVSAINTSSEKTALLDLGADDYLAKPFDMDELVARVRVLLRRKQSSLTFGNVNLNVEKRTVMIGDQELLFQNKEFLLLKTFITSPGKIFNKNFLYEHVWEMSTDVESNVVEATVNKLRRRLEEAGASIFIKSMRNKGYWVEE